MARERISIEIRIQLICKYKRINFVGYLILPVDKSQTKTSLFLIPLITHPPHCVDIATDTESWSGFHFLNKVPLWRSYTIRKFVEIVLHSYDSNSLFGSLLELFFLFLTYLTNRDNVMTVITDCREFCDEFMMRNPKIIKKFPI